MTDTKTTFREPRDAVLLHSSSAEGTYEQLKQIMQQVADRSSISQDLLMQSGDENLLYHLSPSRANLLRPLSITGGDSVLEIYCSTGSQTRLLAERAGRVVAFEPSYNHAEIARLRCRDLDNVEVVDKLDDITELFDIVVTTASQDREPADEPCQRLKDAIELALRFLKPTGCLVFIADSSSMMQIHKEPGEPRSRDKKEQFQENSFEDSLLKDLETILENRELNHCRYLIPNPDHRTPDTIFQVLDQNRKTPKEFRYYQWLPESVEILAKKKLEENNLFGSDSEVFLVVAGRAKEPVDRIVDDSILLWKYNTNRAGDRANVVKVVLDTAGNLSKLRIPLRESDSPGKTQPEPYIAGETLIEQWIVALDSSNYTRLSFEEALLPVLRKWYQYLVAESYLTENGERFIDGDFVESLPWNLVETEHGTIVDIDREWRYEEHLPVNFILFRGLFYTYSKLYPLIRKHHNEDIGPHNFYRLALSLLSIDVTDKDYDQFVRLECSMNSELCSHDFEFVSRRFYEIAEIEKATENPTDREREGTNASAARPSRFQCLYASLKRLIFR